MKPPALLSPSSLERAVKWVVPSLLAYWLVYALVVPVTIWDSQTYNVARLLIARDGGLFGNDGWNNVKQASFPWGYDAVHYPFLFLGFGYALPSFACLIGVLLIIHRLVRESHGIPAAWWCCLAMLALPTLMYQATSTKNDIPVLFGVACWFYALKFWKSERRAIYLLLMALALVALLSAWTLWQIGWKRRELAMFTLFLTLGLLLLGSSETYIYNVKVYHHLLGPPDMVRRHMNRDGPAGAAATAIRIFFGLMNVGVDVAHPATFCDWLSDVCRGILRFTHLREIGYYGPYNDERLHFLKDGGESSSDFGIVGMLALFCAIWVVLRCPWKDALWKLSTAGFLCLGLTCYTVGWQPWINRFLLLPMVLFTLAFILGIVRHRDTALYRHAAKPLFVLLLFSAVVFPLYSYNKGPENLRLSIAHRDEMITKENPPMLEIVKDIEGMAKSPNPPLLLLHAGKCSLQIGSCDGG